MTLCTKKAKFYSTSVYIHVSEDNYSCWTIYHDTEPDMVACGILTFITAIGCQVYDVQHNGGRTVNQGTITTHSQFVRLFFYTDRRTPVTGWIWAVTFQYQLGHTAGHRNGSRMEYHTSERERARGHRKHYGVRQRIWLVKRETVRKGVTRSRRTVMNEERMGLLITQLKIP